MSWLYAENEAPITGDDAVRPEESAAARLLWAFDIEYASHVAWATMMDAVDYRGQVRSAILEDCLEQMSAVESAVESDNDEAE